MLPVLGRPGAGEERAGKGSTMKYSGGEPNVHPVHSCSVQVLDIS